MGQDIFKRGRLTKHTRTAKVLEVELMVYRYLAMNKITVQEETECTRKKELSIIL